MIIHIDTEIAKQSAPVKLQALAKLIKEVGYTLEDFTSAFLVAQQMPDEPPQSNEPNHP